MKQQFIDALKAIFLSIHFVPFVCGFALGALIAGITVGLQ